MHVRLGEFVLSNIEPILADWEAFAHNLAPGRKMTTLQLRDDAESILRAAVRDMAATQSHAERASKSRGQGGATGGEAVSASDRLDNASTVHGVGRVGSGFDLDEVVSEYRALRATVLRLWRESNSQPNSNDLDDVTRFNESMDQSLGQAVAAYTNRVDQSRRMFLAILGHDLRNPLNAIMMSAHLVSQGTADPESSAALSSIEASAAAIGRLVNDLLDFAATGLGASVPLAPGPLKLETLCRDVIAELKAAHPGRAVIFDEEGDLSGEWDAARLRQVISNLLGNAIQHGAEGAVSLKARGHGASHVELAFGNGGTPISREALPTLFDPLVRGPGAGRRAGSIGLGLYIAREIVAAHGGTIDVASSADTGTVFTVRLPRQPR